MSEFKGVTVVREANVYFGGNVTSRTVLFPDGSKKTLGVMLPGDYEFSTGAPELMEILAGSLEWRLAGEGEWKPVSGGGSFRVPGNSKFVVRMKELVDYCCSFLP